MTYDEIATKLVERTLYVIEQYTAGATEPLGALPPTRYDALCADCHRQVLALLTEYLPLTLEEGTPC